MLLTDERSNATRRRIQAAVEAGLKGRGVSGRRASLDVVGNDGLVRDIRAGVMPAVDRLEALFSYLGIGFDLAPALHNEAPTSGSDLPTGLGEGGGGGDRDIRALPWLEPRIGQGSAPVGFSLAWLASEGLVIDRLRAVIADQVQLPGGLAFASLALVETPSRPTEEPECWAFYEKGRLIIGRIHLDGDLTVVLPADGARARLYRKTDLTFRLLGRVVWMGILRP